jgi:[ribosomal protein S5]-alanine N-acetyltransferase
MLYYFSMYGRNEGIALTEKTFPIIETDRLLLREIKTEDAQAIYAYFSDDDVTMNYGMSSFTSAVQALQLITSFQISFNENKGIRWGIVRKDTNEFIGTGGFHNVSKPYKRCEIGYEIAKDHWNQGFATEAATAILSYGFQQYNRIGAIVLPENTASINLVEKIGFQKEGLLREYLIQDGKARNAYMYSIIKSEWQS